MKIAWISDSPRFQHVGQSRVGREFINRFIKAGHEVVAIGFNEPMPEKLKEHNIVDVTFPVVSIGRENEGIDPDQLIARLEEIKPDVIVLSHDPFLFWMIEKIREKFPNTHICGYYTIDAEPVPEYWSSVFYNCDSIVSPTRYGRRVIKERFPDLNVEVVPYGIDSNYFTPINSREDQEKLRQDLVNEFGKQSEYFQIDARNKFVVIGYGHNQGKKNWMASRMAWEIFGKNKNDVTFFLVLHSRMIQSRGWMYPGEFNPKDFISVPNLIMIPNAISDNGLRWLVQSSNVLLTSTIGEGFFIPALEAMACGTVPMTTHFAGPTDYLTNKNSFPLYKWVPIPGEFSTIRAGVDPNYIASRLEEAYKMWKTDPTSWDQLRQEGVKTAKSFDWDQSTKKLLDIISQPRKQKSIWELSRL